MKRYVVVPSLARAPMLQCHADTDLSHSAHLHTYSFSRLQPQMSVAVMPALFSRARRTDAGYANRNSRTWTSLFNIIPMLSEYYKPPQTGDYYSWERAESNLLTILGGLDPRRIECVLESGSMYIPLLS